MAAKAQKIKIDVRVRQLDENDRDVSQPIEFNKTLNVEMHNRFDFAIGEGGGTATLDSDPADSIVTPIVVVVKAPDGQNVTLSAIGDGPVINFALIVNSDGVAVMTGDIVLTNDNPTDSAYPAAMVSGQST